MFLHLQIVSCSPLLLLPKEHDDLVGGLEHEFYCSIYWELTNSYCSEGLKPPPPTSDVWEIPKLDLDLPRSFAAHPLLYKSSSHAAASYDKPWLGISEMSHLVDQMATELPKKDAEGMCKARCFIHRHSCPTYFGSPASRI